MAKVDSIFMRVRWIGANIKHIEDVGIRVRKYSRAARSGKRRAINRLRKARVKRNQLLMVTVLRLETAIR